jgi:multicomponent Na+:H+ antiporter subunit E
MQQPIVYALPRFSITIFIKRVLLFALIWLLLTEGRSDAWGIGAWLVLVGAALSVSLAPPLGWSLYGVLRFIPFFFRYSLIGGVDVARRAFSRRMALQPAIIEYPLALTLSESRLFMVGVISLLPGTLSAEVQGDKLWVHVLDQRNDIQGELELLECRVASLFRHEQSVDKDEL